MATKTPGKLDIKSLQSKFEQTKKDAEPIVSHKRIIPKEKPSLMQNRPQSIKPPNKGSVANSQNASSSHAGKDTPPTPPVKAFKATGTFASDLESTLQKAPKVRPDPAPRAHSPPPPVSPVARCGIPVFPPRDNDPHEDLEKADSVPMNAPPPVPTASDDPPELPPSITYKGKRLPSKVEVNGVLYKLMPLGPDTGQPPPAKPARPQEVVPIVPELADDEYDNNKNLLGSLSRGPNMDQPGGSSVYGGNNGQNYEDYITDEPCYEGYDGAS